MASPPDSSVPRRGAFGVDAHIWRIASVTILGSIMSVLDATIVNVALESLGRDLHSSLSAIQWVVTGYLLALAAVIPIAGWTSRRFGGRRVYLASIVTFTAGSVLCGFAWSTTSLIAFRVLQGVGGGLLMPVGQMMVARAAGPERMGRVMSVLAVPIVLAPVLGPALGGALIEAASWRWIFFINVPVGIAAFALGLRQLPRTATEPAGPIDLRGLAMLALGLPGIVYGLAEIGQGRGADPVHVLVPLLGGALLVVAFALHALRASRPILDVRLFGNAAFASAAATTFVLGGSLFGAMILMPLFFQTVHGESAAMTGLLVAPQGLGAALAMPISGKLTDRIGGGIVAFAGVLLIGLATIPFIVIDETTSYAVTSLALALRGVGMGIAIMPAMSAAYAVLRRDQIEGDFSG